MADASSSVKRAQVKRGSRPTAAFAPSAIAIPCSRDTGRYTKASDHVDVNDKLGRALRAPLGNNLATALAMSAQCIADATPNSIPRKLFFTKQFQRHSNVSPMPPIWQTTRT